jgi:hypothetical protein
LQRVCDGSIFIDAFFAYELLRMPLCLICSDPLLRCVYVRNQAVSACLLRSEAIFLSNMFSHYIVSRTSVINRPRRPVYATLKHLPCPITRLPLLRRPYLRNQAVSACVLGSEAIFLSNMFSHYIVSRTSVINRPGRPDYAVLKRLPSPTIRLPLLHRLYLRNQAVSACLLCSEAFFVEHV